ncbi:MAG TPA: glycerophosphodiester phosphodiesterase family protein [Spirochaetota bacterium]|nr:glycerophosphodiester phosphodiesterase family protein [Spirochaetota bacterium]
MKPYFEKLPVIYSLNGGVKHLPQNTLQAFRAGFDEGADAASVSVQLSSDSEVMVISSDLLEKVSNGSGTVISHTAASIKAMDAAYHFTIDGSSFPFRGKGFSFITLSELLSAFPGKKFSVVLMQNDSELVKRYADTIKNMKAGDRVITSSYFGNNIKLVRKILPGSATAFSMTGIIGVYGLFKSGLIYFTGGFTADVLQTAEYIGMSYIVNSGLVRMMHKKGIWVQVWDIKDAAQYNRLADAGVDSFMTEDVPAMKKYMAKNH